MPNRLTPRQILDQLVKFPTVSRDTNLPLIDWVENYLSEHGVQSHRHIKPDDATKAALFAHVGPEVAAVSVITNMAAGLSDEAISHAHTKAMAPLGAQKFESLLRHYLKNG